MVAVTGADGPPLGVDVEAVDPRRVDDDVVRRFLPSAAAARIAATSDDGGRAREVAVAWTRLEAEAKGRRRSLDALAGRDRTGSLVDLEVGPDHVATLWTDRPVEVRPARP